MSPALRRAICVVAVVIATAAFVGRAAATETSYYGYNYLSPTLPAAGAYCSGGWTSLACTGWNNWDYNRLYKNSGGGVALGFAYITSQPTFFRGLAFYTNTVHTVKWDCCGSPEEPPAHYNRAGCWYNDGNSSYAQCAKIIN